MVTASGVREKRCAGRIDGLQVVFDDDRAVAGAGLILPATLAGRLGLEGLIDEGVDLGARPGAARPGRKVMTLVHAILAGADCIDDCQLLRSGEAQAVLGHRVMAPSTLGTFLRSFSFGHVRQLDRAGELALGRAWAAGAGPGAGPLVIDLDSTICEVHGYHKQGAGFSHTRVRGYHPLVATRSDTGEVLHLRMRKGQANTMRGAERFVRELAGRVRRAGATGSIVIRADSGFWAAKVMAACRAHRIRFSIGVRAGDARIAAAIAGVPEADWQPIAYTAGGRAEVAETTYRDMRLIVRRTRLTGAQAQLFPDWRHHAFVTDRPGSTTELDADHRAHAVIELAIRDLKAEGLAHCPSGRFGANAAWALIAALAHNLVRWVARLGLGAIGAVVAKTLRARHLSVPGRISRSGRRSALHMPRRWPWAVAFATALERLRAVALQI
jgi:Transposase DDE domain group 1